MILLGIIGFILIGIIIFLISLLLVAVFLLLPFQFMALAGFDFWHYYQLTVIIITTFSMLYMVISYVMYKIVSGQFMKAIRKYNEKVEQELKDFENEINNWGDKNEE